MADAGESAVAGGSVTATLAPVLAVVHFVSASWLSFVLFGLAGGIETDGRWTRYGGIESTWTGLAWLPGGLLVAAGGPLTTVGFVLLLAGSGTAGFLLASAVGRLVSGARPGFGRWSWRLWLPLVLWLVWVPVSVEGTITYWHTVAY